MLAPHDPAANQLGRFEHANMLGGCWKRHLQGGGKLAEAALADRELADDGAAGGVGQGVEHAVELRGTINNHVVYYTIWFYDVNRDDGRRDSGLRGGLLQGPVLPRVPEARRFGTMPPGSSGPRARWCGLRGVGSPSSRGPGVGRRASWVGRYDGPE